MKGLRKWLAPFAPDSSGAVSVLFDLNGIVVICDAGGCTGNVCAFDEPRWFQKPSAIFSAGLRDMDAILGRDDKLVAKLKDTAQKLNCKFAAIVGTPVPAVIATDYHALCRMAEKESGLPTVAIDCTGTRLYDEGASETFLCVFRKFTKAEKEKKEGRIGVLGVTPLDFYGEEIKEKFHHRFKNDGYQEVIVYGYENGLEDYIQAGSISKNIVVSPAGIGAAQYMEKTFGIPYEIGCPIAADEIAQKLKEKQEKLQGKKILVIHQQIYANEIRNYLEQFAPKSVTVASWFMMKQKLKKPGDKHLTQEDEWHDFLLEGAYDLVIADVKLKKVVKEYEGEWVNVPHYAISGQMGCETEIL